jgi:hypothetical protein
MKEGLTDAAAGCTLMVYLMVGVNARRLILPRISQPARFLLGGISSRSASWPAHSNKAPPFSSLITMRGTALDEVRLLLCAAACRSSLAASLHGWATARRDGRHDVAPTRVQQRFRTRSADVGGAWEVWERPYVGGGHKTALCGSCSVGARRGRPERGCAARPRRRAAERSEGHEFCSMQNTPCSAPSTVATQARHGGRKERLTAVTQVL